MCEYHLAHPAVAYIIYIYAVPAMVLSLLTSSLFLLTSSIIHIPYSIYGQVLYAALPYLAINVCGVTISLPLKRVGVGLYHIRSAVFLGDGGGDGGIEGDGIAIDGCDGTVPCDVDVCGFPTGIVQTATEVVHLQRHYPLLGAWAHDMYPAACLQTLCCL